ncbi:MAG: hypothetical protein AAGC46_12845 [Solirubrobacteraceae bacterium]
MADEEAPLSPTERDQLDVALRSTPDPFLGDLLDLAQHGTELAVGLLVNGMIVIGRLDRQDAIAGAMSTMRHRLIERSPKPDDQSDEQWEQVKQGFASAPLQYQGELYQREANLNEQLAAYVDEGIVDMETVPADLARTARELSTRSHITLSDARIAAPGQDGMTALPVMRVAVAHVTGWWFAMPEEDGTSNIELWAANRPE